MVNGSVDVLHDIEVGTKCFPIVAADQLDSEKVLSANIDVANEIMVAKAEVLHVDDRQCFCSSGWFKQHQFAM